MPKSKYEFFDRIHTAACIAVFVLAPAALITTFLPEPNWVDTTAWVSLSAACWTMLGAGRAARRAKPAPAKSID